MNGNNGFTYPAALVLIMVTGISLMAAQTHWSTMEKRQKEKELLFRGDQIRRAIKSYYSMDNNGRNTYPASLNDLIKDPRFLTLKRHLRKIYTDPITGTRNWGLVLTTGNKIKGVYSTSEVTPLKKGGFHKKYNSFTGKKKYMDWKFIVSST